jgi:cysteine protease ATG4
VDLSRPILASAMTVPKYPQQHSPSSTGDMALISPVSSTSSHPSTSSQSHGSSRLPQPPPADRQPAAKSRSTGPQQTRFTLRRKDKEKGKDKRKATAGEEVEEDWTMEGTTEKNRHGHDVLISPPSREDLRTIPINPVEEPASLFDSQMTEVPPKDMEKKKSRGRGLVKKTSKLFLRGDRDRDKGEMSSASTGLAPRGGERQQSYSSATSNDSAVTSASSSNASIPMASVSRAPPPSGHSRRLSHDSQFSWQGAQSVRSNISNNAQPTGMESRRMSNSLSASVPALSRNSLPQPGQNSRVGTQETIPSRMSSWFTNLLPSTSTAPIFESQVSQDQQQASSSSPARKGPSAAASFLYAARQKAVDGVRNLLDSEAQPDKSPDTIWLMGVGHPGYRPSSPFDSPNSSMADLPTETSGHGSGQRRDSNSSGTSMSIASPSFKADQAALRPAVWPKRRDPMTATSPPAKGIGNLFSPSSLSLALPTSSPQKDTGLDSPGKGKKKEREILKWPEQCKLVSTTS